ncbi:MAG: glycerophosphodiester phosphodiesterase [Sandaracinaceae bacterium]|nr:glycerophosphodiester phosphodiesterase [Sandaracinaceae bacterium]
MSSSHSFLLVLVVALSSACEPPSPFVPPDFGEESLLRTATPLPRESYAGLEGNYLLSGDAHGFGQRVVLRGTRVGLSLFGNDNGAYANMRAGCSDGGTRLVLEGYWRHSTGSDAGLVRLFVEGEAIASALCAGTTVPSRASLRGNFTDNDDRDVGSSSTLSFDRPLVPGTERFHIIVHSGCRTVDDCGASENTIEAMRLVEGMGATGIELDVNLTADEVPILFHDDNFSSRLVRGRDCVGPVNEFTLAAVRELCAAKYGEAIPTLSDALSVIIDETLLTRVWLDVKQPEALASVMRAVEEAQLRAELATRDVRIVVGLPDLDSLETFVSLRGSRPIHCVYEIEPEQAVSAGCAMWGPRWTRGPSTDSVRALQSQGIEVVFWTIDETDFIDEILRSAGPNGIVTDRPGVVLQRLQEIGVLAPEFAL